MSDEGARGSGSKGRSTGADEDSLLREIDFLILAAEQSGNTRDSIRLMVASLRDINVRIKRVGEEVNAMRSDLHRQVTIADSLPALEARVRKIEDRTGGEDFAAAMARLEVEWRRTKFILVGLFVGGGVFTLFLLSLAVWAQVYLIR